MTDRTGKTVLFGFSAMIAGAASAWSLAIFAGLVRSLLTEDIPERLYGFGSFWAVVGLVVAIAAGSWLVAFSKWVVRLPTLRLLSAVIILAPFLLGFGLVANGLF